MHTGLGRTLDHAVVSEDEHGCPDCPHVADGPATEGSLNVKVNGRYALRVGDPGEYTDTCCGPGEWHAKTGSGTVRINGKPAHRLGDDVQGCGGLGILREGSENVRVGGPKVSG